jgi:hypothetical protein
VAVAAVAVAAPASIYKSMDYNGAWEAASLQDLVQWLLRRLKYTVYQPHERRRFGSQISSIWLRSEHFVTSQIDENNGHPSAGIAAEPPLRFIIPYTNFIYTTRATTSAIQISKRLRG